MNRHELLSDAAIRDAFERRARRADAVDLRNVIIGRTATMPQRRSWTVASADTLARPHARRLLLVAAVVALLSALAVGLALVGHQGPALRSGLGAFVSGGDVYLGDPGWTDSVKILDDPDVSFTKVTWIDGGRRLAVEDGTAVTILDPATGERSQHRVDGYWLQDVTWAADGRSFAYAENISYGTLGQIVVVDALTGTPRRLPVDLAPDDFGYSDLAMSPEGQWLVATSIGGIVRIDARTGAAILIRDLSGDDFISDLAWSPDSTRLAYVTSAPRDEGPDRVETPDLRWVGVMGVMGADGSDPVAITAPSHGILQMPAWSPDGLWIAFQADAGLSMIRPDGRDRRDLIGGPVGSFTWSPDGRRIELVRTVHLGDATGSLWEVDVASGEARPLGVDTAASIAIQAVPRDQALPSLPEVATATTPSPTAATSASPVVPASAPPADPAAAGWNLLVATDRSTDCYQVELGDLSTGALQPQTGCGSGAQRMTSSPSGDRVLLVDHGRLVLQRLADGSRQDLTSGDSFVSHAHSTAWSPRGTWFTWTICPSPPSCSASIMRADGIGHPRTFSVRYEAGPSWSPNEAWLAFQTPDGAFIARGDGSDPRPLGPDVPSVLDWSPDGSQIAYVHDGNAWLAAVDGSAARPVTDFEFGGIGEISWSPDGQHLAIEHDGTAWLAGIDGSLTRLDPGPIPGLGLGVSWAPNGRILAIGLDGLPGTATTVLMPLDGRASTSLPGVGGVTWSADAQFIAYVGPDGTVNVANADGSGGHPVLPSLSAPDSLIWVGAGSLSGG